MHDMFGYEFNPELVRVSKFQFAFLNSQSLWISFSGKDKKIRENLEWVHRSPYPPCHSGAMSTLNKRDRKSVV